VDCGSGGFLSFLFASSVNEIEMERGIRNWVGKGWFFFFVRGLGW
jgi:hypothetical protein